MIRPRLLRRLAAASSVLLVALLVACEGTDARATSAADLARQPWDSVVAQARGSEVVWLMWRGDPSVNAFVDGWVAPRLAEEYGIRLRAVDAQGPRIVNQLLVERDAGRASGSASLLWINGETFANLHREELLDGPWAGVLPNAAAIDSADSIIMRDFGLDPAGYESPWGRVQMALIYDTTRTPEPPRTVAALRDWIRAHPGRFTHDQGFTGITFLKTLMYAEGGGVDRFAGGFDEVRYTVGRDSVFAWLDRAQPAFWRGGATFPPGVADLHRLFANGEVDFSMSNNHNEVVTKVRQGILPPTARAFVLRDGTIANSHFVGIPFNAPNAAGAMVVANLLLSPAAQLEKLKPDVWADGTVLAPERLTPDWRARFAELASDPRSIPRDTLARYARPEVAPEYHERLQADWRARVQGGR